MRAERARQFLPFAALKGFDEMLREIERETEPKHELTEEDARRLNNSMANIQRGTYVHILHYKNGVYKTTEGIAAFVDTVFRKIFIGEEEIAFDDIWDITSKESGNAPKFI